MPETFTTEQMREMMKTWRPPELPVSAAPKTLQRSEVGSTDGICPLARITGDVARRLAESRGIPAKEPVFEITVEGNGIYMGYDSGLDYDKDGSTYETEWKLWPAESGHIALISRAGETK